MQRMLGMTAGLTPSELTDYSLRRVPEPLAPRRLVLGIRERVDWSGAEIGRLREDDVRAAAATLRDEGVEAVAVSLPLVVQEPGARAARRARSWREQLPGVYVTLSSDARAAARRVRAHGDDARERLSRPAIVERYTATLEERLGDARSSCSTRAAV